MANEKGIAYVLNTGQLVSFPPGDDLMPLVAKKLNITLTRPADAPAVAPFTTTPIKKS